jgi:hypothetical protein
MKTRCYNPNTVSYQHYGGRGIRICSEWRYSFTNFYNWAISHGWRPGLTIERRNNDGNYEPSNCMFIPAGEQAQNNRRALLRAHQIPIIRERYRLGESQQVLAADFGVADSTISAVVTRMTWKNIIP